MELGIFGTVSVLLLSVGAGTQRDNKFYLSVWKQYEAIMALFVGLTLAFCCVALLLWLLPGKRTLNGITLPPGPRGIPILGNAHQIAVKGPLKFSKWAQQYGKMYTVYIGSNIPAVVISDIKLMKQIFGTMASTGRLWNIMADIVFEGDYGILNTGGKTWLEQRYFLQNTLKDFGFGNKVSSHLESRILQEIKKLSDRLENDMRVTGTVKLYEFMKESAGGTIWALVTGKCITPQIAEEIQKLMQVIQKVTMSGLIFFPSLKYIAPKWSGYTEAKLLGQKIHSLVAECFEEHERENDIDSQKDIVSAHLKHSESMQGNPQSVFFGAQGKKHINKTITALLLAGVETSATTLNWLLFYLSVHADVQRKLQEEIDEVLEDGRDPNLADKERMVYTEAVILESLRFSSGVPYGMIHQLTDNITVQGQTLPKGLALVANTFHVHHDPSIWGDPEDFRPERFLEEGEDEGGNKITQIMGHLRDSVVIFQPGRRTCVGEPLARDMLFMFTVKLFQTFNFIPEEGRSKEDYLERQFGSLIVPSNVGLRVERRA